MKPYKTQEIKKSSFFEKIFKIKPKKNALLEIVNLLAEVDNFSNIKPQSIEKIAEEYKINLSMNFKEERENIFEQYIKYALEDKHLSEKERDNAKLLKQILFLNDGQARKVLNNACKKIYEEAYQHAITDGRISEEERKFLQSLSKELWLAVYEVENIRYRIGGDYYVSVLKEKLSDERLSPQEEEELKNLADNLGFKVSISDETKLKLNKYRLYWLIENGEIPEIKTRINLIKGEKCYFSTDASWHEYRSRTRRINYGGPTLRLRIAKGLYWSAGSLGVNRITEEELKLIDTGTLMLTNKRILFMGNKQNKSLNFSRILDFEIFSNGIELQKDRGKNVFLSFSNSVDIFTMILSRMLKEK